MATVSSPPPLTGSNGTNSPTVTHLCQWVTSVVSVEIASTADNGLLRQLQSQSALTRFVEDPTCTLLIVQSTQNNITCSNALSNDAAARQWLFCKTSAITLSTVDKIKSNVILLPVLAGKSSDKSSPLLGTLYQSIHAVYRPALMKDKTTQDNARLQSLVTELETSLGQVLLTQEPDGKKSLIESIQDEIQFWQLIERKATDADSRKRAQYFSSSLNSIGQDFGQIENISAIQVVQLLDKTQDVLDDIWKQDDFDSFPLERMQQLLQVIGNTLILHFQSKVTTSWTVTSNKQASDAVHDCLLIGEKWTLVLAQLTEALWPRRRDGRWTLPPQQDTFLVRVLERLKEIQSIRDLLEQCTRLLDEEARQSLNIDKILDSFANIPPLEVHFTADRAWQNAASQFYKLFQPIERQVASRLQAQLSHQNHSSSLFIQLFERYADLIARPTISQQLTSEKQELFQQLKQRLQESQSSLEKRLENPDRSLFAVGKQTPAVISNVLWSKQAQHKLQVHEKLIGSVLKDVAGINEQTVKLKQIKQQLTSFGMDQYQEWLDERQRQLADPQSLLNRHQSGHPLSIDFSSGALVVSYSDALVSFLREARQFGALGYTIPAAMQQFVEKANTFYRFGVVLKQVAHFYNTADRQMLACQQSMLLPYAFAFEQVIKRETTNVHNALQWDDVKAMEAYVQRVQSAADQLANENRKLRQLHDQLGAEVLVLYDTDLVQHQKQWKERLASMRQVTATLQSQGYTLEQMQPWLQFWDQQLFKALQCQYQLGLETLHEHISEIKVELQVKQNTIVLKPPLEEVRAKYYRELKKFLSIPIQFKGLSGQSDNNLFATMISQSAKGLASVYERAEQLFSNVGKVCDVFAEWLILDPSIDLPLFIDNHIIEVVDYETQFKMLKQRGREAEQLPLQFQVDCIVLSCQPLKAALDDQLQRLFDALLQSLRRRVHSHLGDTEQFLNQGMQILSHRPSTLADIGQANQMHAQLSTRKQDVRQGMERAETFNRLLRSVSGSGVDISSLQSKWDKLELLLDGHELMIKEQVESMRQTIQSRHQGLDKTLDKMRQRWQTAIQPLSQSRLEDHAALIQMIQTLQEQWQELQQFEERINAVRQEYEQFQMSFPEEGAFTSLKQDMQQVMDAWSLMHKWMDELKKLGQEYWITFRLELHQFEDHLTNWKEKFSQAKDAVASSALKSMDKMQQQWLPLLKVVKGTVFVAEHWSELFKICQLPTETNLQTLKFQQLLDVGDILVTHSNEIKELAQRAQSESALRQALEELDVWGANAQFSFVQEKNNSTCPLIKEWKETLTQIGDQQSLLQSLKDSASHAKFEDKIQFWETKLVQLGDHVLALNQVQRKWVYLAPIFSRGALPSEQDRFQKLNETFLSIMRTCYQEPKLLALLSIPQIKTHLPQMLEQLERCQRALSQYLEEKRSRFARFYFIGDDDLLEILGQSQNPQVIQSHLKKLFAGINLVVFDSEQKKIVAVQSAEGELVSLKQPVQITAFVEEWLQSLSLSMQSTLQQLLKECLAVTDVFKYPEQILCLAERLHFTQQCEQAIKEKTLGKLYSHYQAQLKTFTDFTSQAIEDPIQRHVTQLKIKSLILDMIYYLDVIQQLQQGKVNSLDDFVWQRQLKCYLSENQVQFQMCAALFQYTWEYQGNPPKLVHTQLTDKCYLTLTQAMKYGYGGNPFGPAGTGKTESVKALAVILGRQCLVFNCDEGLDYKSMGRIFIGIVKCGAWSCLDEFNRLEESVLSAVSQQIQVILSALKANQKEMTLLEQVCTVDPNSALFVTLNPAGKGYGGRQRLPDNLKQLFRPVAMSRPQNELIAETLLLAEGFTQGKVLGRKMASVFQLSLELLSAQQHYDWGLRPLKSVLTFAGQLRRGASPEESEQSVVIQALRRSLLSKLTHDDVPLFERLLDDVFGGPLAPSSIQAHEKVFLDHVKEAYQDLGYTFIESQAEKVVQLYESTRQRMGVVVVGASGSGKSVVIQVLFQALKRSGQMTRVYSMNPKATDRRALLGHMDLDTREWTDGILTAAARASVRECSQTPELNSYLYFDGDIDPEWIESLNSTLDDNHLLSIPNGERLQFPPQVHFLFETHELVYASPATVSRMGMIYLSQEPDTMLVVEQYLKSKGLDPMPSIWSTYLKDYFEPMLKCVLSSKLAIPMSRVGLIRNALSYLNVSLQDRSTFLSALCRGLVANLVPEEKPNMLQQFMSLCQLELRYDQEWDSKTQRFSRFQFRAPRLRLDQVNQSPLVFIPTVHAQFYYSMLFPWLKKGEAVLVAGPQGVGKKTLISYCLQELSQQISMKSSVLYCSAQTNTSLIQQRLLEYCQILSTAQGRVLSPRSCDRFCLWLMDVSMPRADKYQSVELHCFLHQLLSLKGFYNEQHEWIQLQNIQLIATCSSQWGKLSPRWTGAMKCLMMEYPEKDEMKGFCQCLLEPLLQKNPSLKVEKLSHYVLTCFDHLSQQQWPNHVVITPRDLVQLIQNLLRYPLDDNREESFLTVLVHEMERVWLDRLDLATASSLREKWSFIFKQEFSYSFPDELNLFTWTRDQQGILMDATSFSQQLKQSITLLEREREETVSIPFLQETCLFVTRLEKCLSSASENANAVLLSSPGMHQLEILPLIGYRLKMQVMRLNSTHPQYTQKHLLADLKQFVITALKEQPCILIVEDEQLALSEQVMDAMNSLLSSGQVQGLFSPDELETLYADLKRAEPDLAPHESWTRRFKKWGHFVFWMDAQHALKQVWFDANPALTKYCQIIWCPDWRPTTAVQLARHGLKELLKESKVEWDPNILIAMHRIACEKKPFLYAPLHYQQFLEMMGRVYEQKQSRLSQRIDYLNKGLETLQQASYFVDTLTRQAQEQSKLLQEKQAEADRALTLITQSMSDASEQKQEMQTLSQSLLLEEERLMKRKQTIEQELAQVEPLIQQAKSAVGEIKAESLNEIRSLRAPPPLIRDLLEGVLRLFGHYDTSWQSMKSFLGNKSVKDEILNFDARRITPEMMRSLQQLIKEKPDAFEEMNAKRTSVAAGPLAVWIKANLSYAAVLSNIKPLEDDLAQLSQTLTQSKQKCKQLEDALSQVDTRVLALKQEFTERTREAEQLKLSLTRLESVLNRAKVLLQQLTGEKSAWQQQVEQLKKERECLVQGSILAAAYLVYASALNEQERQVLLDDWKQILVSNKFYLTRFDFISFLFKETDRLQWKSQGLHQDRLSEENAAILLFDRGTIPLLLDPTEQASHWLKNMFPSIEKMSPSSEQWSQSIEWTCRLGKMLMIQQLSEWHASFTPLMRVATLQHNNNLPRRLLWQDKWIEYQDQTKWFFMTRQVPFSLPKHVRGGVRVFDFSVTERGLQDQLLHCTLTCLVPKWSQQQMECIQREEEQQMKDNQLEERLLSVLIENSNNNNNITTNDNSDSSNPLLENEALHQVLKELQVARQDKLSLLKLKEKLNSQWQESSQKVEPFAEWSSQLYSRVLSRLNEIHVLYRMDLQVFMNHFMQSISLEQAQQHANDDDAESISISLESIKRMHFILVQRLWKETSPMLLQEHVLKVVLKWIETMKKSPFDKNHSISEKEWQLFHNEYQNEIKENLQLANETANEISNLPDWIPSDKKMKLTLLLNELPLLKESFLQDKERDNWYQQDQCELCMPVTLSRFHQCLLVQCLRPDRLEEMLTLFCCDWFQVRSLKEPLSLENVESKDRPLLFITTPGMDPLNDIQLLAEKQNKTLKSVAMGQGQGEIALQQFQMAMKQGHWLYLMNVHLMSQWLFDFEKIWEKLEQNQQQNGFQLFLSTEVTETPLPNHLLGKSMKWVMETAPGMKAQCQRTLSALFKGNETSISLNEWTLIWCHSVIMERKRYLPLGWTRSYEFSLSDARLSHQLVTDMNMNKSNNANIDALTRLLYFTFGARLETREDEICLETLLYHCFYPIVINQDWHKMNSSMTFEGTLTTIKKLSSWLDQYLSNRNELYLPENCKTICKNIGKSLTSLKLDNENSMKQFMMNNPLKKLQNENDLFYDFLWNEYETIMKQRTGVTMNLSHFKQLHVLLKQEHFQSLLLENLSCILRPKTLLLVLRQVACRLMKCAMDDLYLDCYFKTTDHPKNNHPFIEINQIYIQGARLSSTGLLQNVERTFPSLYLVPCPLIMQWKQASALPAANSDHDHLECPLYLDREREELLCRVRVSLGVEKKEIWILKGVAFFSEKKIET